jgi:hypothetical protein
VFFCTPKACVPSGSHKTEQVVGLIYPPKWSPQPRLVGIELNPGPPKSQGRHRNQRKGKPTSTMVVSRAGSSSRASGVLEPRFPLLSTVQNKVYSFVQTTASPVTMSSSVSGTSYGNVNFILNLIDQYTSFTGLFDQYRIRMVETRFVPRVNMVAASAVTNTGQFVTVVDNDDSNNLTSFAQAEDYENAVTGTGYQAQTRTQVPHAALAAYSGSFSSYANVASPWIDCTSPTVQHYGCKMAWTGTDQVYVMDITNRYWFEFRNVR